MLRVAHHVIGGDGSRSQKEGAQIQPHQSPSSKNLRGDLVGQVPHVIGHGAGVGVGRDDGLVGQRQKILRAPRRQMGDIHRHPSGEDLPYRFFALCRQGGLVVGDSARPQGIDAVPREPDHAASQRREIGDPALPRRQNAAALHCQNGGDGGSVPLGKDRIDHGVKLFFCVGILLAVVKEYREALGQLDLTHGALADVCFIVVKGKIFLIQYACRITMQVEHPHASSSRKFS